MNDLISRQDAADFLCDWCGICPKEKRNIMECDDIAPNFAKIPTVDAVEVVRCGECKHMSPVGVCTYFADSEVRPSASDFCSYGERKTDG